MTYRVKVRRIGSPFWRKYRCVGDGIIEGAATRFLILENDSRMEFSLHRYVFWFGPDRMKAIEKGKRNGST